MNAKFDFSSAINKSSDGSLLKDFVFSASANPPGSGGVANWKVSTSTSPAGGTITPAPTGADAIITTNGWYTFQHDFHGKDCPAPRNGFMTNCSGTLEVIMTLIKHTTKGDTGVVVKTWTVDAGDAIGTVGGNRYGKIFNNTYPSLKIDDEFRSRNEGYNDGYSDRAPLQSFVVPSTGASWTIRNLRVGFGCGSPQYNVQGMDAFEISIDGRPPTIFDFERN